MVEYMLGNYMISKDMLTRKQFEEILQRLDRVRVKLGLIAVMEGYLTLEQAEKINHMQSTCDKRFGEIAVEEHFLTKEQLDKLLKRQSNAFLVFVQSLIDERILRIGQIDEVLEQFRQENDLSISDLRTIKEDHADQIVKMYIPMDAEELVPIIQIAVRMMQRCIDRYVYIDRVELGDQGTIDHLVAQRIEGDGGLLTAFSERDGGMLCMAGNYAMEDFELLDEDALDAVGEFLNCINGVYIAETGRKMDLRPPTYQAVGGRLRGTVICRVTIGIGNGKMYFWVSR